MFLPSGRKYQIETISLSCVCLFYIHIYIYSNNYLRKTTKCDRTGKLLFRPSPILVVHLPWWRFLVFLKNKRKVFLLVSYYNLMQWTPLHVYQCWRLGMCTNTLEYPVQLIYSCDWYRNLLMQWSLPTFVKSCTMKILGKKLLNILQLLKDGVIRQSNIVWMDSHGTKHWWG